MAGVKTFFKFSCLGCLTVIFLFVAVVGIFGWISGSNATFTEAEANYTPEQVAASLPLSDFDQTTGSVNRVKLFVSGVESVVIRPCEENEGLAVEASYNDKRIDFSETWGQEPDGTWSYNVEMKGSGSEFMRLVEQIFNRREDSLNLCLPADAPVALEAQLERVGLEAELGGLWLTTLDIGLDRAGAFIGFGSPLREPVSSMSMQVNMGGVVFHGVGNASPGMLNADYKFAGLTVDMSGDWKQDSQIDLKGMASGVTVIVPRSVGVEGVPDLAPAVGSHPETNPTLFFAPGTDFEDISVRRH